MPASRRDAGAGGAGAELGQKRRPQVAHVWDHRPVYKRHQVRRRKLFDELVAPKARLDILPGNFIQLHRLAEHHFAVVEFQRVRAARFGDAVHFSPPGEFIKNRVHDRISQRAYISDFDPQTRERIGHDRPVAAQLGALHDRLYIGALSGRLGDPVTERFDRRQPLIMLRIVALIDHVNDFVNEPIQTHESMQPAGRFDQGQQPRRAMFPELLRFFDDLVSIQKESLLNPNLNLNS